MEGAQLQDLAERSGDRFAGWTRSAARAALAAFAALLIAAILTPLTHTDGNPAVPSLVAGTAAAPTRPRDLDLGMYDAITARIAQGENYYAVAAQEHRKVGFPLRPGVAVRLPTLVYLNAWLGPNGLTLAAFALLAAVLAAWWRRLGEEPGGTPRRLVATALLGFGAATVINPYFFQLHELWAGMLLALAFGLHRPGRWIGAWLAAAAALAIREHALPFVLLMAAFALWRGERREAAAWGALIAAFLGLLALHLNLVAAQTVPTDGRSAPWLVLRGLTGWLSDIVLSSNLRFLPHPLANALVVLAMLGWAGWRSAAGAFGALLFAGYALLFMLAGRVDNYYWGAMVAPPLFIGLAFAPMALRSLWRRSAEWSAGDIVDPVVRQDPPG